MKTKVEQMERIHLGGGQHFIITKGSKKYFTSYGTVIAIVEGDKVTLNKDYWNYSKTTAAYRNRFLGETTKETEKKIATGEYKLRKLGCSILTSSDGGRRKYLC